MKKVFPKKLSAGDTISVIAPSSSGATVKKSACVRAAKNITKQLGISAIFSEHFGEKDVLGSSSLESRVQDLHAAFRNKNIAGIVAVRGGYNANTLLAYIDWQLIIDNPKPICGFSDITVLANAIYAKTGLVTYIGPNYSSFGDSDVSYTTEYFKKCLLEEAPYEIKPSKKFWERKVDPRRNPGHSVLQEGKATGTIIGGHLSSLNLLQGTEFMPSLKDSILFLETDDFGGEQSAFEFERDLQSLLHFAKPGQIKGLVLGRFQAESKMNKEKLTKIILSKKELSDIPVIIGADFGHTKPLVTLPIGGQAQIEAASTKARISILKH